MASDPALIAAAIGDVTSDPHVIDAMLVGSYLESGFNPDAVGDGSYGPFQLQLSNAGEYPGVTPAMAETPIFAARTMVGQYTTAAAAIPDELWASDPETASEETADHAERPEYDYFVTDGQSGVNAAWSAAQAAEGYVGTATGDSTGTAATPTTPTTGTTAALTGVVSDLDPFSGLASSWEKLGLELVFVAAGIGLAIIGAVKTASPSTNITQSMISGGKKAAEVAAA